MMTAMLDLGINLLFGVIILTPVLIMLGMCVVYFLFDVFQKF